MAPPGRTYHTIVFLSLLFFALVFAVFPLPYEWNLYRPDGVALIVIYWALFRPQTLGTGRAWCIGLLQDVCVGSVWGAHALALSVTTYICLISYRRLRSYALSQQTYWVFVLVGMHHVLVSWIQSFSGYSLPAYLMLIAIVVSALCWPILVLSLQKIKITATA